MVRIVEMWGSFMGDEGKNPCLGQCRLERGSLGCIAASRPVMIVFRLWLTREEVARLVRDRKQDSGENRRISTSSDSITPGYPANLGPASSTAYLKTYCSHYKSEVVPRLPVYQAPLHCSQQFIDNTIHSNSIDLL